MSGLAARNRSWLLPGRSAAAGGRSAAEALEPMMRAAYAVEPPFRVRFWDGSTLGPENAKATIVVRTPLALRRMIYAPGELGMARAFVAGELDIEGDLLGALADLRGGIPTMALGPRGLRAALASAVEVGAAGGPLRPPEQEARPRGRLHSRERDSQAVRHHYDVGNEFYRLVLGPSMTYSCARFVTPEVTLEEAQEAKHELICAKLGLREGMRLLDVGCGWGSLIRHAARRHGVRAVGITLSPEQQRWAARAAQEDGVADLVEVRVQDYRDLAGERFDAIASVGMFEHVGGAQRLRYFEELRAALNPGGRLLNHAISKPGGGRYGRRSFLTRYVFPDGELQDVSATLAAVQQSGLEVRDVECLREHYPLTLRRWVANLERRWEDAVALVGAPRARIWRLYMAGSVIGFEHADISVHQVLAVKLGADRRSEMPMTRRPWG